MILDLDDATPATAGGKAGRLAVLVRAGLPVPRGFVVTQDDDLHGLGAALDRLGDGPVAVRSSASDEDGAAGSAAGQYDSHLGVVGRDAVRVAVLACRDSLWSTRAVAYRQRHDGPGAVPAMAVLVQRHVEADIAGVLFTGDRGTVVEASWGLGEAVVAGRVTPDRSIVAPDGTVRHVIGDKRVRIDRDGGAVVTTAVPDGRRHERVLDDAMLRRVIVLGQRAADLLGGPQDVEWAVEAGRPWLLQARPVTAALGTMLDGAGGSAGTATGSAVVVRGLADFARVAPGDILVCSHTDPAWTPVFTMVAGVVTETGGLLSHAAIVARERGIPAVLGVAGVMDAIGDGALVTIDGSAGTIRWR